jgi:copper chaperone
MTTTTYRVEGMTCGHCVAAVESEVGAIAGVTSATADLASGRLDVTADQDVDAAQVQAAVAEAGYEVVG